MTSILLKGRIKLKAWGFMHPYLLWCNGLLAGLVKLFNCLLVITQILLTADKNDGKTLAEMEDFRDPL